MGLTKKDKIWIETTIRKAIAEALTLNIKFEQHRDLETGQPLATPKIVEETVSLQEWIARYIPYTEGALRGMQEDVSRNSNKMDDVTAKMSVIGNVIIQAEDSLKCIAAISDRIKQLDFTPAVKLLEEEDKWPE